MTRAGYNSTKQLPSIEIIEGAHCVIMLSLLTISIYSLVCILSKNEGAFLRESRASGKSALWRVQISEVVAHEAILQGTLSSGLYFRQCLIVTISYGELSDGRHARLRVLLTEKLGRRAEFKWHFTFSVSEQFEGDDRVAGRS